MMLPPLLLIAAALLLTPSAAAPAHEPPAGADMTRIAPGTSFLDLTFEQGLAEAARRKRLLLVYLYDPENAENADMEAHTWRNPTLAAFIQWHCVPIKVRTTLAALGGSVCPMYRNPDPRTMGLGSDMFIGRLPAVRLYHGRQMIACVPTIENDIERVLYRRVSPRVGNYPPPMHVLHQIDTALQALRAREPAWYLLHERANPMPQPPPKPGPFHLSHTDLAAAVEDPLPDELVAGTVWDRLDAARRAVRVGDLYYATGLYTWLWERGAELDPAFAPARRSFLAAEIADLARRRPGALERFTAIRDGHSARLLWADHDELQEWLVLNGIVADEALTIEYFDMFLNDRDEAAMIPPAMKAAYEILLSRDSFADALELGKDPVGRITRLSALLRRARPVSIVHEDWEQLQALARALILEDGCRLHAACLAAGRDADAGTIAKAILQVHDTAPARRAIITTALIAGHPRPLHTRLLDEADADSTPTPDLRARLEAALNPVPAR